MFKALKPRNLAVAALWLTGSMSCFAQRYAGEFPSTSAQQNRPSILSKVGLDQKLNSQIPLDSSFRDESGKVVRLGDYFGQKPVILALVYYQCPMLCTEVLNGLTSALDVLKFSAGKEFNVVNVSIDPSETPEMAQAKKKLYLHRYGRPGAEQGWHMLTGTRENIDAVAEAVGFRYAWDEQSKQWAHASGVMVLTPEGRVAQYYYGIEYSPKDLRLGLIEASKNKIGSVVDAITLYCFHYDPTTGKYGLIAIRAIRIAAIATLLALGTFMFLMFRKDFATKPPKEPNGRLVFMTEDQMAAKARKENDARVRTGSQ